MSTHWGYVCQQDGERVTELFTNPGRLHNAAAVWPLVRGLFAHPEYGQDFEIDLTYLSGRGWSALSFFAEHYDHGIAVESEHGDVEPVKGAA